MHPMAIPTANPDLPHGVTSDDVEGEEVYERPDPRIDAEYEEDDREIRDDGDDWLDDVDDPETAGGANDSV